jgi:hypothetical protein
VVTIVLILATTFVKPHVKLYATVIATHRVMEAQKADAYHVMEPVQVVVETSVQ